MNQQFGAIQKLGQDSVNAALKAFEVASTGTKAIAVETADYTKTSLEQSAATFQKLFGVKSLDKAIEIQTDYVKGAYDSLVAQSTKLGTLYSTLATESLKPFEGVLARKTVA